MAMRSNALNWDDATRHAPRAPGFPVPQADSARAPISQPGPIASGLLDAVSRCAIVVDGRGAVRLASVTGMAAIRRAGSGMAVLPAAPGSDGAQVLTALHRDDAVLLRRLVASAAQGGAGGTRRIRPCGADDGRDSMQVAFVMPLPPATSGLALVKIEDLVRRAAPSATTLCDLFGFSRAEAEVAVGLIGGAGAEEVAASRGVSLDTVRGQIRAILRKSDAANLRDFERLMATVASVGAECRGCP